MKNATTIRRPKKPDKLKFLTRISKKTQKAVYLEASKYISDLTKLIFGGIILTNILNFNIDKVIIFVAGTIAIIGFVILS
ncbi:MAG: hypothetical protein LUH01_11930, partial [Parabacteroides gordonii]|nr:hypothetical protein [Parabacteroides gordonii]